MANTAYIVDYRHKDHFITEVTYENKGPKMLTGVKKVKDHMDDSYYMPSRVDLWKVHFSFPDALDQCQKWLTEQLTETKKQTAALEDKSRYVLTLQQSFDSTK